MPSISAGDLEEVRAITTLQDLLRLAGGGDSPAQGLRTGARASTRSRTARLTTISCSTGAAAAMNPSGSR
jgi:hypothetical protein